MEPRLFDAHCHLDLMAHPDAVADEATALGLGLFDCGVNPRDFFGRKRARLSPTSIIAGVKLHPVARRWATAVCRSQSALRS